MHLITNIIPYFSKMGYSEHYRKFIRNLNPKFSGKIEGESQMPTSKQLKGRCFKHLVLTLLQKTEKKLIEQLGQPKPSFGVKE